MSWIALRMLTGDRVKFLGIIFGVSFASLLMAQQMSIFCGIMMLTTSQIRDVQGVDLWVSDSDVLSISEFKPMSDGELYRVRSVPGVRSAVPFFKGVSTARLRFDPLEARQRRESYQQLEHEFVAGDSAGSGPARSRQRAKALSEHEGTSILQQVMLLGVDGSAMIGAPAAASMVCGGLDRLGQPDAVVVDEYSCRLLWREEQAELKQPGDYERFLGRVIEVNDRRAVVVGVCKVSANFETLPIVYTTYKRAQRFVAPARKVLTFVFVDADPDVSPAELSRRIARYTGYTVRARTPQEFVWDTIWYYMMRTGIPFNFGMTVGLGFLVGAAIAGQTFYQFTVENLRQFGALKAMGTSNLRIVGITLLQSMVAAPIGYGVGVGLAAVFGRLTENDPTIGFYMPWQVLAITAAAVLTICLVSGLLSVRRVLVLEPAIVFRM